MYANSHTIEMLNRKYYTGVFIHSAYVQIPNEESKHHSNEIILINADTHSYRHLCTTHKHTNTHATTAI